MHRSLLLPPSCFADGFAPPPDQIDLSLRAESSERLMRFIDCLFGWLIGFEIKSIFQWIENLLMDEARAKNRSKKIDRSERSIRIHVDTNGHLSE